MNLFCNNQHPLALRANSACPFFLKVFWYIYQPFWQHYPVFIRWYTFVKCFLKQYVQVSLGKICIFDQVAAKKLLTDAFIIYISPFHINNLEYKEHLDYINNLFFINYKTISISFSSKTSKESTEELIYDYLFNYWN